MPLKCPSFSKSFSKLVCMLPVTNATYCQVLWLLGQRSRSQGSWRNSHNYHFYSKMHTVWWIFIQLGMDVACDKFNILTYVKATRPKVKVTEVMLPPRHCVIIHAAVYSCRTANISKNGYYFYCGFIFRLVCLVVLIISKLLQIFMNIWNMIKNHFDIWIVKLKKKYIA